MGTESFDIYDGDKPYLFISYSHLDEQVVFPILQGVQQAGFRVWMDRGIEVGTEWSNNIADRLRDCGGVLFFVSKNSINSENCLDEIACAKSHKKAAILIFLEDNLVLPSGVEMQTARFQRMYATRHSGVDGVVRALISAPVLQSCRRKSEPVVAVTDQEKKICSQCGAPLPLTVKFCPECGRKVEEVSIKPVVPVAPDKPIEPVAEVPRKPMRYRCEDCGEILIKPAARCPMCGGVMRSVGGIEPQQKQDAPREQDDPIKDFKARAKALWNDMKKRPWVIAIAIFVVIALIGGIVAAPSRTALPLSIIIVFVAGLIISAINGN